MKFDILNRFTGALQFSADIDCDDGALNSVKIGLAVRWGLKNDANLSGAYLSGAYLIDANLIDANLSCAYLSGANLSCAYLSGANLSCANLSDANLSDANLSGANLSGANLSDANLRDANLSGASLIHCGTRSDGYEFYAHIRDGEIWIKAGCRYFEIKAAAKRWRETRGDDPLGAESQQLLKNARALVKIRGLLEAVA